MELKIERRLVDDLVPYEANSKRHGEEDIAAIARSIERFGFNDPIAVTPEGVIIEGHGRWMALQRLGWTDVPVLVIEGLTEDQYDLYRVAHNKIALTSHFNFSALFDALQDLVGSDTGIVFADMGFGDRMVNDLFAHFGEQEDALSGAPSSSVGGAASTAPIEYDVIWDSKEDKARFGKFIADEVAAGADKSMGGEILLAAIAARDPDMWRDVCENVPGDVDFDQIAGQTDQETLHVTQ